MSSGALLVLLPSPSISGAEAVAYRVVQRAVERGLTVLVAAPSSVAAERAARAGAEVVRIPSLQRGRGGAARAAVEAGARDLAALAVLVPLVRRRKVGTVVANGALALPVAAALRQLCPGLGVAWLVHDVFHRPSWLRLARVHRPFVDRAVAVSRAAALPLVSLGYSVEVAPNGTAWPVEPAAFPPPEPPILGCAALLTPWKGQDLLLEAVRRCAGLDGVRVELLGGSFPKDGAYVERLETLAALPGLAGRVRLLGHVEDPLPVMRRWTAAVVASRDPEAGPLVLLEYLSLGLPVAAPAAGACAELLAGGGALYPPGDVDALGAALERLVADADWRASLRELGRARVERSFVAEPCADRQLDCLLGSLRHDPMPS